MRTSDRRIARLLEFVLFVGIFVVAVVSPAYAATLGGFKLDVMGILNLLSPVIGLLLLKQIRTPRDHQRAALLAQLASDIADVLILERKGATFADLLKWLVAQLREHGVTQNDEVLNRVAKAALKRAGVEPR